MDERWMGRRFMDGWMMDGRWMGSRFMDELTGRE